MIDAGLESRQFCSDTAANSASEDQLCISGVPGLELSSISGSASKISQISQSSAGSDIALEEE